MLITTVNNNHLQVNTMDKRDFKTHPHQWSTIVDFGEEHPTIFRPQFKHGDDDARQNAICWEKLVQSLNSMGFGFRSVEKWKMAVGRWKSKVKVKAAQLRIESQKTGGGCLNAAPLTDTEERLMKLIGWKSVTGNSNAELGLVI
ncbi:unnamed protein product [Acanthoscelides obtectus]|uniref:Regulatory protein zeste n=1 Tax=Acanthoscelides obtectus TaxID=200917 RepID=A0A9P0KL28_ACAOB|nr:unnamed protein product [Acanthoscelides obtectus]CAK1655800.1 hypothetical protein AOBTE_LOCUS19347 [Acanthoscelides obtectus]